MIERAPRINGIRLAVVLALALAACSGPGTTTQASASPTPTTPPAPASQTAATPTPTPTAPAATATPATPEPDEATLGAAPIGPTERATVVRVVDGDTIVIDRGLGEEKLRYIGVDTPETVAPGSPVEWMGPEASAANKRLVEGRTVVLERDVSETDSFGRLLRYVWLEDPASATGWTFVNLELVARGFAQVATYPPDVRYVDLYLAAQQLAREQGRGLWAGEPEPTPATAPTDDPDPGDDCDPAYPTVCIPPAPPDLDCGDIPFRRFTVLAPDPHRFDSDRDGIGCES